MLTGVTPTLAAATSSAHTSASATKASTATDALVSVGKGFVLPWDNTWARNTSFVLVYRY